MLKIFKTEKSSHRNIEYELERYSVLDEVAIYRLNDNDNLLDEELDYLCGDLVIDEYFDAKKLHHTMRTLFNHSGNLFQIDPVYDSKMFIEDCLKIKETSFEEGSNSFSFEVPCIFFNEFKVICVRVYYSADNKMYYLAIRKLPYVSKYMGNMYNRILKDCITGLYSKVVALKDLNYLDLQEGNFLVFLDIDNFKHINDEYGHLEGDRLLAKLGDATISTELKDGGTVKRYRFGGDEFLLICQNTNNEDILKYLIDVQSKFRFGEKYLSSISFSAGVVEANQNIKNYDRLLLCADKAMYKAKTLTEICYFMSEDEAGELIKNYSISFDG